MQTLNEQPVQADQYVDANTLRELTLTPDQLFEIAKTNICDSLMSSMVSVATKNGATAYGANIMADMSDEMLNSIVTRFTDLGYTLSVGDVLEAQNGQKYRVLKISWEA